MFSYELLSAVAAVLSAVVLLVSLRKRPALDSTTLSAAWGWAVAAESAWLLSSLATLLATRLRPASLDQLWYWTAVLTVCPLIAVLGSRRPTSRVWNWFIIVPLIAVLGWPALTVLRTFPDLAPLRIQAPVFIGFALALVMGGGNYAGTRFGSSLLLICISVVMLLVPFSARAAFPFETALQVRSGAAILFSLGLLHAFRQGTRETVADSAFDRLWFDFRDAFGIVWSIRIQERINAIAEQEGWSARLGPDGFHWQPGCTPRQCRATHSRIDHTLRWLLRRFVDPAWIERRLSV